MRIKLVVFGNIRSDLAIEEKRLLKLLKVLPFELKVLKEGRGEQNSRLLVEEKVLESTLAPQSLRIILDEKGKTPSSQELSDLIFNKWAIQKAEMSFVIGSSYGFSENFKVSADYKLALSTLTLTHDHARILCLEQIYRAWAISQNHPYHHI